MPVLSNEQIAHALEEVATLLEEQGVSRYRVQAWRNGAATIHALARPVGELLAAEGLEGLDQLPGIGPALARAVRELAQTGRLATLERLHGESDPVALLASVPGIGEKLARRVRDDLGVDSLEALELAAHDGRLATVDGFGVKRIAGIGDALATRLAPRRRAAAAGLSAAEPSVDELLDVDREYRERVAARDLTTIAPKRFNPTGERWLPVLHTTRGTRHYTALFSNTALAHSTRHTHDWVVLYYDGKHGERQCTVVTAPKGPLARRRVVRGRERECVTHYELSAASRWRQRARKAPTRRSYSAGA